ncbi:Sterol regulatory element-binding protein 1 [Zalerion maritima]|uniref:Sterol regulatory element-binding protein 1 n=1 Tax=Zalerion maritima TaxID=339359 RepID=A0AAD5RYT9_9PEZI|nr:Sterol regulatory element-binding protein 1 [Zalerion maritima]
MDYFAVPNNQTVNPVDQNANLTTTNAEQPAIWDTSSLPAEATNTSMALGAESRPDPYKPKTALPTRAPPHRTREGHERKRSKLSTETATQFDSVDYWLDFENDEGANGNGGAEFGVIRDRGAAAQRYESTPTLRSVGLLEPDLQISAAGGVYDGGVTDHLSLHRTKTAANQMATPAGSGITPENGVASGSGTKGDPDDVDDDALDNALSDNEDGLSMNLADQLSKIDSAPPADVPPREGLYSTPLSWEKPQPGLRMDPLFSLHNNGTLNQEDQQRLIAIAMNPGSTTGGLGASIAQTFGPAFGAHAYLGANMGMPTTSMSQLINIPSQSQPHFPQNPQTTLGRNVNQSQPESQMTDRSSVSASDKDKDKQMKGDRTAHNDIERKYRTNLKDKIAELRDAVPALRPIPENGVADDAEAAGQPARAPKVSKV